MTFGGTTEMNFWKKCMKSTTDILKWILISLIIGIGGGLLGTLFHISVEHVIELREKHSFIILFLPLGGLVIAFMYNLFRSNGNIDTKRVFQSIKEDKDVPLVMIPLIFIGTVITHMLGGSAGREGAALQLGGSMGYNMGKALKQKNDNLKLFVSAGMSSVFSALFGTPLTATVFSLEVTRVGMFNFKGLFPGVISSLTAYSTALFFDVAPVRFSMPVFSGYGFETILKVIVLAVLCAGVCIVFATSIHKTEHIMERFIPNSYVRAAIGGAIIVLLTIIMQTTDYNSVGMHVIGRAISGDAKYEAFLMKIIFTAITVAAGFKGGEIVPTFFIGATFGCVVGSLIGIGAGFGAALGFVALFSGMTKCPIAAFLLAIEVFGVKGIAFFAIVTVITFVCSGHFGLYDNKKMQHIDNA